MKNRQQNNPCNKQSQDKQLVLQNIIERIEKGTGKPLVELKSQFSEDQLFFVGLKHVTTTKKGLCTALKIPVEAGCRYKRDFEKRGLLVQSSKDVVCPYTKHFARLLSTNQDSFEFLLNLNDGQLRMSL